MSPFPEAAARRRSLRVAAGAIGTLATIALMAPGAEAAFTLKACEGSGAVRGQGASFQNGAQAYWRTVFNGSNGCNGAVEAPSYNSNGSGNGIASMGGGGGSNLNCTPGCTTPFAPGTRDTTVAFSATDEPPTPTQINNMNAGTSSPADDARVHLIPVAAGANAVIVHAPEGCDLSTVVNKSNGADGAVADTGDSAANKTQRIRIESALLEKAFAGTTDADTWGEIAPGISGTASSPQHADNTPCTAVPVKRIVRQDVSGTTYGFKAYLDLINPARGWDEGALAAPNTNWPAAGGGAAVAPTAISSPNPCPDANANKLCSGASSGNGNVVTTVKNTDGAIGYSDLSTARGASALADFEITPSTTTQDYTFWLPVQNNPGGTPTGYVEPTLDAKAHAPAVGAKGANCANVPVQNRPTAASSPGGDPTLGDWSKAFAAGGSGYPACVLTYILAWDDSSKAYGNTAAEENKARRVKDFLTTILGSFGQQFFNIDYSALPNAVRNDAAIGVAAIDWNKGGGSGGGTTNPGTGGGGGDAGTPPATTPPASTPPVVTVPSNAFSIPSSRVSGSQVRFSIQVPGAGRLTLRATARSKGKTITVGTGTANPTAAGPVSITLKASAAAKKLLKKKGSKLRTSVVFTFTPQGGTASTSTRTVTLLGPKKAAKKKRSGR